jgi:hypothetical protein
VLPPQKQQGLQALQPVRQQEGQHYCHQQEQLREGC